MSNINGGIAGANLKNSASGIALTTAVAANVTSVTLKAGKTYDVSGYIEATASVGATLFAGWIDTASATFPADGVAVEGAYFILRQAIGNVQNGLPVGRRRITVGGSDTPVYLQARGDFASGTYTAKGFIIATEVPGV